MSDAGQVITVMQKNILKSIFHMCINHTMYARDNFQ